MDTQSQSTEQSTEQSTAPAELTGKRANWTIAHAIKDTVITWRVKGAGELSLNTQAMSAENRERAMLHGMVQRISDAAAMARDPKTGKSATPQQKFLAMQRLVEHYATGTVEWSPARAAVGEGRAPKEHPQAELLRIALALFSPEKPAETIAQFVKERNAAQITALLVSEQLKDAVELAREQLREREAQATAGIDAEELLGAL